MDPFPLQQSPKVSDGNLWFNQSGRPPIFLRSSLLVQETHPTIRHYHRLRRIIDNKSNSTCFLCGLTFSRRERTQLCVHCDCETLSYQCIWKETVWISWWCIRTRAARGLLQVVDTDKKKEKERYREREKDRGWPLVSNWWPQMKVHTIVCYRTTPPNSIDIDATLVRIDLRPLRS